MKINYGKLWVKCEEMSIPQYKLFESIGSSSQTLYKMRHDEPVNLKTIDKLCTFFKCQPDEIMEFVDVPDKE